MKAHSSGVQGSTAQKLTRVPAGAVLTCAAAAWSLGCVVMFVIWNSNADWSGESAQQVRTVAIARVDDKRAALWASLVAWAQGQDTFFIGYDAIALAGGSRGGVVALRDIAENETLMETPVKLHLSPGSVKKFSAFANELEGIPGFSLPNLPFIAFIARELGNTTDATRWSLYLEFLRSIKYEGMPYFWSKESLELLMPSPEQTLVGRLQWCNKHDYTKIRNNMKKGQLGALTYDSFLQASMIVGSRSFGTPDVLALVPVADMFNHDPRPNAGWNYNSDTDVLLVWATVPISRGEEVLISYGERSNPRLLSMYGFTVHPAVEPHQSFRLLPTVIHEFNPEINILKLPAEIYLMSTKLHSTFHEFFVETTAQDQDPFQTIERIVVHFIELYEADEMLMPFRQTLSNNRAEDPGTMVWWSSLEDCQTRTGCNLTFGSRDDSVNVNSNHVTHAQRVKMSEYLALVCQRDMLEVFSGRRDPGTALSPAKTLVQSLQAFLNAVASGYARATSETEQAKQHF
eukprot:gnl/MRDRNA2_/MRDRNA2_62151_c0_seq1.p1 gnl/MRDRNA2_/MRDRNA2_62151_c0~~gnl/MRDRNA2_/MRDRNA2_62151_c0_seq1.p1  ORF type:complete len:516 (-),score=73.47 gnl/MRDRNA2_/MRDRNA2_62151_c0_seq1:48-1595(-)